MGVIRMGLLALVLGMACVVLGVLALTRSYLAPQVARDVEVLQSAVATTYQRELARMDPQEGVAAFAARLPSPPVDVQVRLLDAKGSVLATLGQAQAPPSSDPLRLDNAVPPLRQKLANADGPVAALEVEAGSARWAEASGALMGGVVVAALGFLIVLVIGLRWALTWALGPVKTFSGQIQALGERRFVFEPQPSLREWVPLSKTINVMIGRVQAMLEEKQTEILDVREELDHDPLTGASSRSRFMRDLQRALDDSEASHTGSVVIVHVHGLVEMNRLAGRARADDFLRAVAVTIRSRLYRFSPRQPTLGRLNGSDFGILLEDIEGSALVDWLEGVTDGLKQLHTDRVSDTECVAWIGASTYVRGETTSEVLARVDAMTGASEARRERFCITSPAQPMHYIAIAQWRVLIENALDTGRVTLEYYPVVGIGHQILHMEAVLRMAGPDGTVMPASAFIPPAIRTARILDLDLRALELALARLQTDPTPVAINMSPHSLTRPFFVNQVDELLAKAGDRAKRLWIEVSELGLIDHPGDLERFSAMVRPRGVKLGVDHFGIAFSALPTLHHLLVDYVKLDQRFCVNLSSSLGQQQFVRQVVDLCSSMSIKVIGQGIRRGIDADSMLSMGVAAVTGPAISGVIEAPELTEEVEQV
jgi:EAL domain-containing protein (putative c-di-GMP-specific phosphodiesterase class I)/GGDEF domain-containing protein